MFFTYSTLVLTNVLNGLDLNMVGDKNDVNICNYFSRKFLNPCWYTSPVWKRYHRVKELSKHRESS